MFEILQPPPRFDASHVADVAAVLEDALALADASLVFHRPGLLVEFKTEGLDERLARYEEDGHVSWQIGPFRGHHCHVDLALVERVVLDAEAVPCQGGRPNFTVWFETATPCGNAHRAHGYFSVTLNAPYDETGAARAEVLEPLALLERRHASRGCVKVTPAFREALDAATRAHREGGRAAPSRPRAPRR